MPPPSQLQLDDQERQRALARRSAAKLVAKRSAKLKARQLQEDDELRADKEDELRLGLELQRAELEQQVQRGEARRRLDDGQQKADQGRMQRRITANANATRIRRSLRVRRAAAPAPVPAPSALPETAPRPATGDHPAGLFAATPDTDCGLRAERRAARQPADAGAGGVAAEPRVHR